MPPSFRLLGNCVSLYINKSAFWLINNTFVSWASVNQFLKARWPLEKWRYGASDIKTEDPGCPRLPLRRWPRTEPFPVCAILYHIPTLWKSQNSWLKVNQYISHGARSSWSVRTKRRLRDHPGKSGHFSTKNYKECLQQILMDQGGEKNVREVCSLEELANKFGSCVV